MRTVPVQVGSVSQTVSATGNLQPASQVNANFQTSGTITEIDVADITAGQNIVVRQVTNSNGTTTQDVIVGNGGFGGAGGFFGGGGPAPDSSSSGN